MLDSYPMYFVSYLFDNLKDENENIEKIILFGSFAKQEATKESDVDLFIDTRKKSDKFSDKIRKIEANFYLSREASLFKIKGITNKFSIKIGKLNDWKDLERSIMSTGIILYSRYETKELPFQTKHHIIFFWDKIGKNRGAFLNRMYGFKVKEKSYLGLIQKYSGKKLGKSCVMIPIQYKDDVLKLIKEYEVESKAIEVFV
ncbi:nucleotidyltransferase domain-containing protein [Candidatus Pacearchaeota archaeon]|nr:nucleotidyltransferase domain-containing protein [Candidatus Pacearchaeota archaeon]